MDNIQKIKNFMKNEGIDCLLVNSTNEFLVEYNTLEENSRYKLTGFSGSTGEALVCADTIYLFVDGRYHIQADLEVDHSKVTVVKMQTGDTLLKKLLAKIQKNNTLGVFSKKISQSELEQLAAERNVKLLNTDPLDFEMPLNIHGNIQLDTKLTGLSTKDKTARIVQNLGENDLIYITDLDEVSYLFNMRNFTQNYSAKIKGKCIITKNDARLYTPKDFTILEETLKNSDAYIYCDKNSINAYDYSLLKNPKELKENPIQIMKAQKNEVEIARMKEAFHKTDLAVGAIREYIEQNDNLSEYDISVQLEKEFKKQGATCLSFKSIIAKDKNSALAHYSKSAKDEIITDGSLVLIDCGAYFDSGLATDITRVFVKGTPTTLHKKIYTLVLKAFLNAFNYAKVHKSFPLTGYEIDNSVHEFFDNSDTEGFVFNHGLGHGLGINVHEYPPKLSTGEIAKTPIKEGMCFSIEPGLYREGFFGVRLENSCYYLNNEIHSFVKMNYEKKLIDFDKLTKQEKLWLEEFEVR